MLFRSDGNGNGGSLSARIIGNGTKSDNEIDLYWSNGTLIVQSNDSDVDNDVDVDADTGDNDAEDNTNGDVMIDTGDVDTDVDVDTMVNFNFADADCGCLLEDVLAKISGNGSDTDNTIKATLDENQDVFQDNCGDGIGVWDSNWYDYGSKCGVDNDVDVDADTGDNDAEDNTGGTGGSDPDVTTGDANADIDLSTSGNVNAFGVGTVDLPDMDFDLSLHFDLSDLLDWLMSHQG